MNLKQRLSSGNLLLMELIFALAFFSVAMAATMSVFGRSYEMSKEAAGINMALRESNSAIEIIRSSDDTGEIGSTLEKAGFSPAGDTGYEKEYGDGKYSMELSFKEEGNLLTADITCFEKNKDTSDPLYEISIKHALKGGT